MSAAIGIDIHRECLLSVIHVLEFLCKLLPISEPNVSNNEREKENPLICI